jgi:molecular chaperone GrpE
MPEQMTDSTLNDAALESVAAEVQAKPKVASLTDQKIADLESQLREATERALRTQAELENYRKRMQREMADERKYAVVPFVRDLLPVMDNLERAIEHTETRSVSKGSAASDIASLLDGIKLVAAQFETVLKQHDCVRIDAVGAPFDPNLHQALAQESSDQYPAGIVSRQTQAGYQLAGRVIRPSQVFVSTGSAKS